MDQLGQGRVLRARHPVVKAPTSVEKAIVPKINPKEQQMLALAEELGGRERVPGYSPLAPGPKW